MAYFLPSFFQKRLLRYALSRLELIDTDALDLDSLGIRWGQRSTVELRDVGLKVEKVATLIGLPTSSELLDARIRFLQITVPADIYSSGIICDASGLDVHLRLSSDGTSTPTRAEKQPESPYDASMRSTDRLQTFLTPANLAQSFLETEPKEEREELKAAISSSSPAQYRMSVSSSDDEDELGLGEECISLPSFVAAFLKGVASRLQIKICDISVRVDVKLKQNDSTRTQAEDKLDLVTGLLSIAEIGMGPVLTSPRHDEIPLEKEGNRLISISSITMALVASPAIFSNYPRSIPPTSPSTTMRSKDGRFSSRAPSPVLEPKPSQTPDLARPVAFNELNLAGSDPGDAELEMYRPTYTDNDRTLGPSVENSRDGRGIECSQRLSDNEEWLDNPAYLDSVIDSQIDEGIEDPRTLGTTEDETGQPIANGVDMTACWSPVLHAPGLTGQDCDANELKVTSDSQRQYDAHDLQTGEAHVHGTWVGHPECAQTVLPVFLAEDPLVQTLHRPASFELDREDSQSGPFNAELSESKVFSNEDAQSMYMSAISYVPTSSECMPNTFSASDDPMSVGALNHGSVRPLDIESNTPEADFGLDRRDETGVSTPKITPRPEPFLPPAEGPENSKVLSYGSPNEEPSPSPLITDVASIAKTFLCLDKVSIWIPFTDYLEPTGGKSPASPDRNINGRASRLHDPVPVDNLHDSRNQDSTQARGDPADSFFSVRNMQPDRLQSAQEGWDTGKESRRITVDLSTADIQLDIATSWLLTKVGRNIVNIFSSGKEPLRGTQRSAEVAQQAFNVAVKEAVVKLVEHIPEYAYPLHSALPLKTPVEDVILQVTASGISSHYSADEIMKFNLDVSKFTVGLASEDLLSFNEDLKMRESTRDILAPARGDISFSLRKSSDSVRVNLGSLPIHINFNIQRLDEFLGSLGGVSTILDLGSSLSSVSSAKRAMKDPAKPRRGVHFEHAPAPDTNKASWKVNARLGGIAMDIVGENHRIKLRTTAVKAVSRYEGIGIQVDKAKLTGPFEIDGDQNPLVKVDLGNIRAEYLFGPKEIDLDRLLSLITPSKDKYDEDDDIMLDTLFRQRRQGSVLRITVESMKAAASRTDDLECLSQLGNELGKLSSVTKYLPEDDRPGILTLTLIKRFEGQAYVGEQVGNISTHLMDVEMAYITIPSLIAAQVRTLSVVRNGGEELFGEALPLGRYGSPSPIPPVVMVRFIPDEMDPTIKVKLYNFRMEYTTQSVAAFLGLGDDVTSAHMATNMAMSLANLVDDHRSHKTIHTPNRPHTKFSSPEGSTQPTRLDVVMKDSVLGLNPRGTSAKGLIVISCAKLSGVAHGSKASVINLDLRKAGVMVINDVHNVRPLEVPQGGRENEFQGDQMQVLMDMGYVSVTSISSAVATAKLMQLDGNGAQSIDVELRNCLLIIESCADSTQTLIAIAGGLQPPAPPSTAVKYRTEVMPIQDMLASFSGDAYITSSQQEQHSVQDPVTRLQGSGSIDDELEYVSDFRPAKICSASDELGAPNESGRDDLLDSFHSQYYVSSSVSDLDFHDDHFAKQSDVGGTAHRWDSANNTYGLSNDEKLRRSPLRVRVRGVHVIWNLFDGYDWQRTRDTILKTVKDIEARAADRRAKAGSRISADTEEEMESVVGDFLFNSVYIEVPANKDPRELRADINRHIDDLTSETGSYATMSTVTATRQSKCPAVRGKKLRLSRSKHHKMTFELKGISADLVVFPPDSEETQSSLDVRVDDLEIFDHVPSSTWKKFASYMHEAGERESGTSMVHLEILTVKPILDLAASEIVLKATVLPLRLYVDQDALDFMCRFFEFRDESADQSHSSEAPFLQRVEINSVRVRLDFKPKRVDYAGLRSGRTTEFMNFFVLDAADMVLRHVIIYGVSGFDKLGQTLNDIWMPDVKRNQLPGVLAGLAPIRSLVNVGGGVKNLVIIPIREYQKDGRIVRSIQKGAREFAKTTSSELIKFGAKLAIGTQAVLQGAEDLLSPQQTSASSMEDDTIDEEEGKRVSLYADQPIGVVQGLRGAFSMLERDMLVARDAVIAVPGEVIDSGSAKAAAKAIWKRTPTVILRPAIGVTKAVGQTLLGAGNTLDPSNRRRMEDKYKHH